MIKKGAVKKEFLFVVGALIVIGLLSFVFSIEIFATKGGTHFHPTEDVSYIFNFTINNTEEFADSVNITQVNVTLPTGFTLNLPFSNGSQAAGTFSNTTNILSWYNHSGVQGYLINGSNTSRYFWFNATAVNPGIYNLTILVLVNGSNTNTRNISITVNDTTAPQEVNFTTTFGNYSSELVVFNVSVIDRGTMFAVFFNITNSSGDQNYTFTKASKPSSYYWNASINVSLLTEGKYNITAWTNDTYNNANRTGITQFTVDRTSPVVTLTQSTAGTGKYNIQIEIAITDTLSKMGQDCTANYGGSAVTFTGGSDLSQTMNHTGLNCGTSYTYVITCIDLSGNSGSSASTTYSTDACSNTASGSTSTSSSTTWKNTYSYSDKEFSEKEPLRREFLNQYRVRLKINNEDHYVGVKALTSSTATIEVSSTPQEAEFEIGETKKFEVTDDTFYDLSVTLNSIENNKADVTITSINEEIPAEVLDEIEKQKEEEGKSTLTGKATDENGGFNFMWVWALLAILIIGFILWKASGMDKKKK